MWVKICATTCVEDALQAAELGADAVGFVFAPSKRQVTAGRVRAISAEMPQGVERVGVFGAGTVEEIAAAAEEARLHTVQLHGGIDHGFSESLKKRLGERFEVIQTVHWSVGGSPEEEDAAAQRVAEQMRDLAPGSRVLIDAKVGASPLGGTGRSFSWGRAADVLRKRPDLRTIVAGGLRPDNVAEAVRLLRPWGVDVASGVEREPGRKDFAKLKAFIENARGA